MIPRIFVCFVVRINHKGRKDVVFLGVLLEASKHVPVAIPIAMIVPIRQFVAGLVSLFRGFFAVFYRLFHSVIYHNGNNSGNLIYCIPL